MNIRVTPFAFVDNLVVNYASWEIPEQVEIETSNRITIVKAKLDVEVDEGDKELMESQIDQIKQIYYSPSHEKYKMKPIIYKVPTYFCIAEKSHYVKFWNLCFGKFLYTILKLIGLAIIVEDVFLILAKHQKVVIKRKVSNSQSCKFPSYQPVPDTGKPIELKDFTFADAYLQRLENEKQNAPGSDFNYAMPPQQPYPPGEEYPQGANLPGEGGPFYGVPVVNENDKNGLTEKATLYMAKNRALLLRYLRLKLNLMRR